MAASISVTGGASAAFGFLGRSWRRAAAALALAGLLHWANVSAFLSRDFGRAWLLLAAYLVAVVMATGGLFRIARNLSPGVGGLQWGAIEWRLLGVVLLRILLFTLLIALFATVLTAAYAGIAAAETSGGFAAAARPGWRPGLDSLGWTMVGGVGLAGLAALCWIALRLYLAAAATVAMSRVRLLSAWPLTKGHVGRILGSLILVLAPGVAVLVAVVIGRGLLGAGDESGLRMFATLLALAAGIGETFLILPLSVGLMIYLYDRLGPDVVGAP
jgi:hypothetical protein